jgi:hypothetical protein
MAKAPALAHVTSLAGRDVVFALLEQGFVQDAATPTAASAIVGGVDNESGIALTSPLASDLSPLAADP